MSYILFSIRTYWQHAVRYSLSTTNQHIVWRKLTKNNTKIYTNIKKQKRRQKKKFKTMKKTVREKDAYEMLVSMIRALVSAEKCLLFMFSLPTKPLINTLSKRVTGGFRRWTEIFLGWPREELLPYHADRGILLLTKIVVFLICLPIPQCPDRMYTYHRLFYHFMTLLYLVHLFCIDIYIICFFFV